MAITNGVHTVDLTMAVTGADRKEVENNARTTATTALGDLSSQFDYGKPNVSGGAMLHLLNHMFSFIS